MQAFNIAELLQASIGTTVDFDFDEPNPDFGPELTFAGPIKGRTRFYRIQGAILAQGQASTTVQMECSRCLEPAIERLQIKFADEFRTPELGEAIQEDEFRVDERHVIDLTEPL